MKLVLAKNPFDHGLAEKLAKNMKVTTTQLIRDIRLAQAVDSIVAHSNEDVLGALFNPARPQTRQGIMRLSRAAPE